MVLVSSLNISRERPDSWRIFKSALNQSITDDLAYKKQKKFHDIDDIEKKLVFFY